MAYVWNQSLSWCVRTLCGNGVAVFMVNLNLPITHTALQYGGPQLPYTTRIVQHDSGTPFVIEYKSHPDTRATEGVSVCHRLQGRCSVEDAKIKAQVCCACGSVPP